VGYIKRYGEKTWATIRSNPSLIIAVHVFYRYFLIVATLDFFYLDGGKRIKENMVVFF
jgi:hypothetical protein